MTAPKQPSVEALALADWMRRRFLGAGEWAHPDNRMEVAARAESFAAQARAQERERCAVELEAEAILVEPEEAPIWEHCASYIRALPDPTSEKP